MRLEVYGHHLASSEGVVEWVKGSLLTDYEKRMSKELYAEYLARYRARLLAEIGEKAPYFYALTVHVEPAAYEEKGILRRLLQLYLYDFTEFAPEDIVIGRDGEFPYRYVDHYWAPAKDEQRHKIDGENRRSLRPL